MRVFDVFTPNKTPTITLIKERYETQRQILKDSIEMGSAIISLSGPSKSGKTVFIEESIGKNNLIQITGAGVTEPDVLWGRIFEIIGTPINKYRETELKNTNKIGAKGSGGFSFGIKAQGEISGEIGSEDNVIQHEEYATDYLQLLIKELGGAEFIVFIDDFHYIPKEIQESIANQIKTAIHHGVKFVCAAVPYHSDDVIRANTDLRGRMVKFDFRYWSESQLYKIAQTGFDALKIDISDATINKLVAEAAGSPQLMQALCLNLCLELNIREIQESKESKPLTPQIFSKIFERTGQMVDYTSTFEKIKDGPKTRGNDRKSYLTIDGTPKDVYQILVEAIACDPPALTIRYQSLIERIKKICPRDVPSGSSISGACAHLAQIANHSENKIIIEWDQHSEVLDIRDPYFLFHTRWNK